jgi:hypothetical protein
MKTARLGRAILVPVALLASAGCTAQPSPARGRPVRPSQVEQRILRTDWPPARFATDAWAKWHLPLLTGQRVSLSLLPARPALRLDLGAHQSLTLAPRHGGAILTYRLRW